jgi:ABC-2 type transport system ATP-binding protein
MISLKGLTVKFGSHTVLNNLNADFEEGIVHGIVGLNGAGKTTFFNTLSCIQKPDAGTMAFQNTTVTHHQIGYLESNNFFYSRITGKEYLNLFSATNKQFDIQKLNELTRLPLDNLIETYSSGMKKKLALLALIKEDKPIYLLDEPFNNLDIESCKILELIVMQLKEKGKTVFISSHIMDTLLPICDCIHLLEAGEFKKRFDKSEFDGIEEELLGRFVESAKAVIGGAM